MIDQRLKKLCRTLVTYSMNVQKGERVLIENFDCPEQLSEQLIKEVYAAGGVPFCTMHSARVQRALLMNATRQQIEDLTRYDAAMMQEMQAYVAFRGGFNTSEMSDISDENLFLYRSIYSKRVHHELRVQKRSGWCCVIPVVQWPSLRAKAQSNLKTFISMSAILITRKWTKPWTRSNSASKTQTRCAS